MKFWKVLRWISCALLLVIFVWTLLAGYRTGSRFDDPAEIAAPKFH